MYSYILKHLIVQKFILYKFKKKIIIIIFSFQNIELLNH